jgi:hypothetical protein
LEYFKKFVKGEIIWDGFVKLYAGKQKDLKKEINKGGQKKERRLAPPLRCRSVGTPLIVNCRSS